MFQKTSTVYRPPSTEIPMSFPFPLTLPIFVSQGLDKMIELLKLIHALLRKSYRDLISALAILLLTLYILQGLNTEKELKKEMAEKQKDCEIIIAKKDTELREVRNQLMQVVFGLQVTTEATHHNDSVIRRQIPQNITP